VKNTSSGKTIEVRPTEKLQEMLGLKEPAVKKTIEKDSEGKDHRHDEMERIESLARKIAELPDSEILILSEKK
jgi:hypothetical protein